MKRKLIKGGRFYVYFVSFDLFIYSNRKHFENITGKRTKKQTGNHHDDASLAIMIKKFSHKFTKKQVHGCSPKKHLISRKLEVTYWRSGQREKKGNKNIICSTPNQHLPN